MSDNPTYRGGPDRPGDEYYDDRYGRPQDDPRGQDPRSQDPRGQDPRSQDPRGQDPRSQDPRGPGPPQPGSPLQLRPGRLSAAGRTQLLAAPALPGPGWLPAVAGAASARRVRTAVGWLRPGLPPGAGRLRPSAGRLRLRPSAAAAAQRLRPRRATRTRAATSSRATAARPDYGRRTTAATRSRRPPVMPSRHATTTTASRRPGRLRRLRPGRLPAHRRRRGHASAGRRQWPHLSAAGGRQRGRPRAGRAVPAPRHRGVRRHLEIRWDGQVALLSDLNSTNGTTVNNAPVQEWQLADGDVIRLGHSEIVVRVH